MVDIMRNRYVIIRDDAILCVTSRKHIFVRMKELGNIQIMTYSSKARAFSSLCSSGFTEDNIKIVEVKEIISEELNGLI